MLGSELSISEELEVWRSARPAGEDFVGLRYSDIATLLEGWHFELWRAKLRYENGSLTGLMDAYVHCARNSAALPAWLNDATATLMAVNFRNSLPELPKMPQSGFKRKQLKRQAQVSMMSAIMTRHSALSGRVISKYVASRKSLYAGGQKFERAAYTMGPIQKKTALPPWYSFDFKEHIVRRAKSETPEPVELNPDYMSQERASKVSEICLRGSWAQGTSATILREFKQSVDRACSKLEVETLTEIQMNKLAHDMMAITPETMGALGLTTHSELLASVLVSG